MIRLTNISGLCAMLCFWYNYQSWIVSTNKNNIISKYIVNILTWEWFPTTIIIILLISLYGYTIITRKLGVTMYIIALFFIGILCKISVSMLMLENTTNFIFLKITAPVPEELRLFYVHDLLMDIMISKPELMTNKAHLQGFQQVIREQLDLTKLTTLNASEIRNYIYTLVNEKPNIHHTQSYDLVGLFLLFATYLAWTYLPSL